MKIATVLTYFICVLGIRAQPNKVEQSFASGLELSNEIFKNPSFILTDLEAGGLHQLIEYHNLAESRDPSVQPSASEPESRRGMSLFIPFTVLGCMMALYCILKAVKLTRAYLKRTAVIKSDFLLNQNLTLAIHHM